MRHKYARSAERYRPPEGLAGRSVHVKVVELSTDDQGTGLRKAMAGPRQPARDSKEQLQL